MEQSPPQNIMRGLPRAQVNPATLPPEYWNNLETLYPSPDQHTPHPPQQLQQAQQQQRQQHQQQHQQQQQQSQPTPMGISWDHPFLNQHQHQHHQQLASLPHQPEQSHGLYPASTPQSLRPNPLHYQHISSTTPHGFGMPAQYRGLQYPQGQVSFDSRPLTASENSPYQTYSFPRNYYPTQHISVPDSFSPSPTPQAAQPQPQSVSYQSATHPHPNPLNSYALPTGFAEENSRTPINFTNEFAESAPNAAEHQTINPQFLDTPQATSQHAPFPNYLYLNPAEFEPTEDPKVFDFYRNDLQLGSVMQQQPVINSQGVPVRNPNIEVAVPMNGQKFVTAKALDSRKKQVGPKKPSTKSSTKVPGRTIDGKSASSSSESETDDSDLEIETPEEPSPIPLIRPADPESAASYDALRAVWSPRNRRPNVDKVKNALVAFKDVVKTVRDAWKDKTQAMKLAENKGENDKAALLRKNAALQRRLMDVVVSATLDKGHPMIVEKLGEHPVAVAAMYSFLLDRHQASDIDGAFTVKILRLLSRFVTMDEDVLQKTNVAKLLPRFVKKGGQTAKELAQKILDNAAASTKRKQDSGKPGSKEDSPSKTSTAPGTAPTDAQRTETAGGKRPREGDSNGQPASKRMVVTSNIKNAPKSSNGAANGTAKRPQEATAAPASRPKANIIAPKPTNLFGSLSSASKRPGTSNAERAAAAAVKPSTPGERKEGQAAAPRPTFSFGDIMADLNKQKEIAPAKPAEDRPPETEEERTKRLRKEARRKLRVTWKPDSSLTDVRFFTHDPEEELGPGDRSQREVGDVKGEGSVLKLHRDLDELEEEDDGGLREQKLLKYYVPSEIDDGEITPEHRARNYVKRCGTQQPTSAEQKAQEHREATTLMVFYTSAADVPPSPKEPPPPTDDEIVPEMVDFGELPDHVKARQERYFAMVNPKPAPISQPSAPNGQFDISNLLKIIQNAPQQQSTPPPPPPQPVSQAPMSDLERTISMFRQQQQPPQQPQPQLLQMPQFPPASQAQAAPAIDFQKLLSVINTQKQMQQPPVATPPPQPSQSGIAPNLAAIISQFSNPIQQAVPNLSQQPQNHHEDPERKRMREANGYDGPDDDRYNNPKRNRPNAPNKKHPKAGLVPCRYWPEGKCIKGDDCTFRHDPLN